MKKSWVLHRVGFLAVCSVLSGWTIAGGIQTALPQAAAPVYEKTEAMVAMRDGIRLNTVILAPQAAAAALPILLTRTPYSAGSGQALRSSYKELAEEGYIFVFQDIRGRFKSEGRFVMQRPPRDRRDTKAVDEASDAYDTIEWLLKNVPGHNGRVGMLGVSYPGWLTVMAMLDPHPALKAASPQASPASMFLGDDFFHNGAFRLSYGFEYAAMMETSKVSTNFAFDTYDTYDWYLKLGPLSNVNASYLHGTIPTWNDFVAHPNFDAFWKDQAVATHVTGALVPALNVAGWWDQEDFYGPLKIYQELEKHDAGRKNYFVAGPWNHGGWSGDGSRLGKISFGGSTGRHFREKIQAPFFAYYLKDKGAAPPEAWTFQTGSNAWMSYDQWPPRRLAHDRDLYFRADGKLSFDPPGDDTEAAFDEYVSDPAHPVPYRNRPIEATYDPRGSGWPTWQVEDQRFVDRRPDVLSWATDPLDDDVVLTGDIAARLFASTSGTDSDWVVKLIDVYPEVNKPEPKMGGYQLMIVGDVLRGRFRTSFEKPEPLAAGRILEYAIDLHQTDHRFLKGHRIMVQIQSTWFPLIDRNPQTYVDNIFLAKAADYRPATQRIYRAKSHPSHVTMMVMPK
jgi:uncharacterized protein